jgi:hypothetical protein
MVRLPLHGLPRDSCGASSLFHVMALVKEEGTIVRGEEEAPA